MATIRLHGVCKRFGDMVAVDNVSFNVEDKQILSLLGPSGCGKTTILQMIAGFIVPDAGEIYVDEQLIAGPGFSLPPEKRNMGMVFQDYAVWPHKSVFANIAFGLRMRGVSAQEIKVRVDEVMSIVGLAGLEDRYPGQMSGGQQQRVALARALVVRPRILLLDEPLSNLDARLRDSMREELLRLQKLFGVTSIYVTHDQVEAMQLSDNLAVLSKGVVQQFGSPMRIYNQPANGFVADFMGAANFLPANVVARYGNEAEVRFLGGSVARTRFAHDAAVGEPVQIVVRPEDITLSAAGSDSTGVKGTVVRRTYLGGYIMYVVRVGEIELRVQTHASADFDENEGVQLGIHKDRFSTIAQTAA